MPTATRELEQELEPFLATLARSFAAEGSATEVAVLVYTRPTIEQTDYDNWDGGTYGYTIFLETPSHLYGQIANDREKIESSLKERAVPLTRLYPQQWIQEIQIHTEVNAGSDMGSEADH